MKKVLLGITYFFVCAFSTQAQILYGTTTGGGNEGAGTINKFVVATNTLTVSESLESFDANPQYTNFIQATDGKLYGMSSRGGNNANGVIFSYDPVTAAYEKLKDFDSTSGANPSGSLMQAADGKLYGMTPNGGSNHDGVIFSYDPVTSAYTKLKDFDSADGIGPIGSLIQASDGKLYGMTSLGGTNLSGVIFSYDPSTSTFSKLRDLDYASGNDAYTPPYGPYGSLMQGNDGKLYGMTTFGGSNGAGIIFSFAPSTETYSKLMDFGGGTNGGNPYGSLMQATDGKLYGVTAGGGSSNFGVMFSFDPTGSAYTKLKDFDLVDGSRPYGSLIQASDGKLYGITDQGGSNAGGVIFSFDLSGAGYAKLKDLDASNEGGYSGSLMQATDGKLYGMTYSGGTSSYGIIFSYTPATATYAKLKDFGSNEKGSTASASLVRASDGKLYGMTYKGGAYGLGVIFSFEPSGEIYTKLKDFDIANGNSPYGSLIQATDGKLYGLTPVGGSNNLGVLFSFDPQSYTYVRLKDFDMASGFAPMGSLIQASDGKLYGMAHRGGSNDDGVIFSFDPATLTYAKLMDFDNAIGVNPQGSFIQAADGKLYGMTRDGGNSNFGVIFSFDPVSSTFAKLKDLDQTNGSFPYGSLIQAVDGKLYGMTRSGGTGNVGVVFSFDLPASAYTKLVDFDNTSGEEPYGNLLQASNGKLYGTTENGGSSGKGVVFSFDPASSTYTKLIDFTGPNGTYPFIGSAFIEIAEGGPLPVTLTAFTGKNNGNSNQLSWKVANEQNLKYYELQRSVDGQNFKAIYQINATGNNSYSYNDPIASEISSLYYYRIKSVDKDGHFTYSIVIKIEAVRKGFVSVIPNPFRNKLVVSVESPIQQKAIFIVNDLNGRRLYKNNKLLSPGTNIVEINETGRLAKGTYLLTIIELQQRQSIKIVKGN